MSECLSGNPKSELKDLRDETCTNLSIQLSLLMKRMRVGEQRKIIVTRKQYPQIEGIPERYKIHAMREEYGDDYLLTFSHENT